MLRASLSLLLLATLASPAFAADALHVERSWARATAPSATTGAAYFELQGGDHDDSLVRAASPVAQKVELHTHLMNDGMMQMRQVPEVPVPANGQVVFKPGGLHVMLIGLKAPLAAGTRFPLELRFRSGKVVSIEVPVQAPGEAAPTASAHHH